MILPIGAAPKEKMTSLNGVGRKQEKFVGYRRRTEARKMLW